MWKKYFTAVHEDEILEILQDQQERARITAGATDLILEMERGVRPGIETIIDISRVEGFSRITLDQDSAIHLGPMVTHTQVVASPLLREKALPLVQACWAVGSPQIRNRSTVAGNLVTASPANDTIAPLMALGAKLILRSRHGERTVSLDDFYTGVRRTIMQPEEMIADIFFPSMEAADHGIFIKHALRRAQAISLFNAAVILRLDGGTIRSAAVTLGAVAPTIIHAQEAEKWLIGRKPDKETAARAGKLAADAALPISDIRSSSQYRESIAGTLVERAVLAIAAGNTEGDLPENPVLMDKTIQSSPPASQGYYHDASTPILTTINGREYRLETGQEKTLLRLLREDAGLPGAKEACGEGECGACTVILDGALVNSCMVPAPRAHGAQIQTVEGLATEERLHPVQETFIESGAIQCGYCTPGFLMSAVKLLEERPQPTREEIKWALSGNLCRCTGYYKIIEAVEKAAQVMADSR